MKPVFLRTAAYLVFYMERETYIDVWQIFHARMDILHRLREPGAPGEDNENAV